MIERGITVADVRDALENGELIEEYKADSPPRYLMLGWNGPIADEATVVTAYEPDITRWKTGFSERRKVNK